MRLKCQINLTKLGKKN